MEAIDATAATDWTVPGSETAEAQALLSEVSQQDSTPGGALGKDEFLTLLVTQLSSQDPLDPMDSSESIAQLAQFSSLEQMQNLNDQMAAQRRAAGLLDGMLIQDQTVEATLNDGSTIQGIVESMRWDDDEMRLSINGTEFRTSELIGLRLVTGATESPLTPAETVDASGTATEQPSTPASQTSSSNAADIPWWFYET